jgi:DNA-binding NarL/FixJ family response regulator
MKSKILIVEDEAITAMELEDRLTHMGYEVTGGVSTGEAALQKIEALPPDLILMDINIRGSKDGIATAQEIRQRFDLRVIYLTAHADRNALQRAQATTPFGYLIKPFREEDLRATIEMAIYQRRGASDLRAQAIVDSRPQSGSRRA